MERSRRLLEVDALLREIEALRLALNLCITPESSLSMKVLGHAVARLHAVNGIARAALEARADAPP
jgi:hypothetical protein